MQSHDQSHIHQLTWLRGLAAFFVIISHTIRTTESRYYEGDIPINHGIFSGLDLGTFGVLLFFALSGCTLFLSNAKKVSFGNIPSFYIKRFFRIWPAFAISILGYMLFRVVFEKYYGFVGDHWIEGQFLSDYTSSDIMRQLFLVSNYLRAMLLNYAYWSLPIEFQYYLMFPLLVLMTHLLGLFGPLLVGAILYFFPDLFGLNNNQFFTLAYSFCGGVSIGYIYTTKKISIPKMVGWLLLLASILFVAFVRVGFINLPAEGFFANAWNFYSFMAIAVVFICLHCRFSLPRKLAAILQEYGEISYSTYLYHNMVIGGLIIVLLNLGIDGQLRFYSLLILTTLITHVIAKLSYKYIEVPTQALGKKIAG